LEVSLRRSAVVPAAVLAAFLARDPAQAGTVRGRVQLLEKGGVNATDLSEVVVYLDGVKGARPAPATATMTMKAKTFLPHVVVVPVGGTVEFPNQDPIFHNVFSVSPQNRFDLELYKRPKSGAWTFKAPGIVHVYCNIHPQMSAVVVVRDNPFYAMAARDGSFALADVPAGKYTLVGWSERGGEQGVEVEVPAEGQVGVQLSLDASNYKRLPHKNKDGKDYAPGEKY
jgi:plastocyanin